MTIKKDKYNFSAIVGNENTALDDKPVQRERTKRPSPALGALSNKKMPTSYLINAQDKSKKLEKDVEDLESELQNVRDNQNKYTLTMPISKLKVNFVLESIETSLINVSSENERDQALLNELSLADILESIKINGQSKPGLVRKVNGKYELVDGSRRLACAKILNLKYMAMVGEIPDSDVRELSRMENEHEKISPYEKAKFYKKLIDDNEYTNWSQLGAAKGLGKAQIDRFKSCCELDDVFVKLFYVPSDMPITFGKTIKKLKQKNEKGLFETADLLMKRRSTFTGTRDDWSAILIVKELTKGAKALIVQPTSSASVHYYNKSKQIKMKHSIIKNGCSRFDLDGCSEQDIDAIVALITSQLNIKKDGNS